MRCYKFYEKLTLRVLYKLQEHKSLKLTQTTYFGKIFFEVFGPNRAKKMGRKRGFSSSIKSQSIIGKNFLFKFLCQMGLKMGPKIGPNEFFYVLRKINAWNFSGFRMKLKQHKGLKLT